MNTPLTRNEMKEAADLSMTVDEYRAAKASVLAKYGTTPTLARSDGLDPLTAHEKTEARDLNITDAEYLASKREVQAKYGVAS